jgi:signal peptidase I
MFKKKASKGEPFVYRVFGPTMGAVVLFVIEVAQIMVIALAIILPVRWLLIMPFIVKGASMEPTFENNEYLIIDELTYNFRAVNRGDVIVFHPLTAPKEYYIKRVIGLPGETININDGLITIRNADYPNGFELHENYIEEFTYGHVENVKLGADEYYVLGDNRDMSLDSRKFGSIDGQTIVGRVWLRGLPFDRFGAIVSPTYQVDE